MKQKDIAMLILIAVFAGFISFFIANKVFITSKNKEKSTERVEALTEQFDPPDARFFNNNSINPNRDVTLTDTNQAPFNGVRR